MGRHLLRRKALSLLFLLFLAGLPAPLLAQTRALSDCRLLHAPVPGGPQAAPGTGLTLSCAQGHRGPEVYSLDIPDTPQVRTWQERYLRSGGAVRALERALFYRRHISARLAAEGLPGELLFLPVLESDYRSGAVSVSGAAGLWQLMANTARPLGLRMDSYLDERRDFFKATDAALTKLRENYLYFSDWPLALAAYNCGLGKLARILRASGPLSFSALVERGLLPRETADYLPRFYALVRLGSYPGRYGLPLSWEEAPRWQTVILYDSVSVLLLAEATGLDAGLLRQANAELEHPITPALPGGYHLKVPAGSAGRVKAAIEDPSLKLLDFVPHRIVSGDTLYGISHQFGVSLDLLVRHNRHLNPRYLPLGAVVAVPVMDKDRIPRQPASTPPPDWEASGLYEVQPGDTLWALSRRYGISCEELAAANKLKLDDILKEGKMLTVPVVTQ
jgi:membrane-bound lytic murein transglycosylase D